MEPKENDKAFVWRMGWAGRMYVEEGGGCLKIREGGCTTIGNSKVLAALFIVCFLSTRLTMDVVVSPPTFPTHPVPRTSAGPQTYVDHKKKGRMFKGLHLEHNKKIL